MSHHELKKLQGKSYQGFTQIILNLSKETCLHFEYSFFMLKLLHKYFDLKKCFQMFTVYFYASTKMMQTFVTSFLCKKAFTVAIS